MNERLSVPEAAKKLGISEGALRQRISWGTIEHEKDADGRVYVFVQDTDDRQYGDMTPLVEVLHEQVEYLRAQLDAEREANRENRRLLAAALERIPELPAGGSEEAPTEAPESSKMASASAEGGEDAHKGGAALLVA